MVKKLEEELEKVNSGSWPVEEVINFITFIQQTFIEILFCHLQLCLNQESGKIWCW